MKDARALSAKSGIRFDLISAALRLTHGHDLGLGEDLTAEAFGEVEVVLVEGILCPDAATRHARPAFGAADAARTFAAKIRIAHLFPGLAEKDRDTRLF